MISGGTVFDVDCIDELEGDKICCRFYPKYSNILPEQKARNAASDLGLQCLPPI